MTFDSFTIMPKNKEDVYRNSNLSLESQQKEK